ncbi:protein HUA2-LIKE 2-like isoform X2 [Andrographis paniculata]|uniref:protein HUA2-LIKE 2-like isoform X2 n=1 Tax=Andrographis paniculata TaxID=175694 RepID=UPI0021E7731E|nr:protein HUA2-LIKE 2-like isoform X2 [Andrographis paniculata]XP_051118485.1 protein HUA2-LIKE 2-like isoform X2 [Andrographis paniculata]
MAPSRRRAANKAAAAAAARRKWNVGDLVLAKVKGFPAWPATVSEPQKWGYPADLKKVVVYFFGTQQIAFCNPVDIEEFTEEKKASLLGKRHGKGADFVRAVKEISDCFEKLKKQEQVNSANGTEETNITNEYNSEESLTKRMKNEPPVPDPPSVEASNNLKSLTEAAVAAAAEDALRDREIPKDIVSNDSLKRKRDVTRSRNSGLKGNKFDRKLKNSRSSSSRPQNNISPVNTIRSSRRAGNRVLRERSLRRSRRLMKPSDDSEGRDNDSLDSVSNGVSEESDSEIMSVDSDTLSVNDGSNDALGTKQTESGPSGGNNDVVETVIGGKVDLDTKNIFEKSSMPHSKRNNHDSVEATSTEVIASDAELPKSGCISPSFTEQLAQKNAKDDGDEHLPFAKRARVRMGRPSPETKEKVSLVYKEENMLEVPENLHARSSEPLSSMADVPADQESFPVKENIPISPLSCASPARNQLFQEAKKNFVDEESALPPFKRLHRALEAMSANAAEDCQAASNLSPAVDSKRNDSCSVEVFSEQPAEREGVKMSSEKLEHLDNGNSPLSASKSCTKTMETSKNNTQDNACVSDYGKNGFVDSTNTQSCEKFEQTDDCSDSKCMPPSPSFVAPCKNPTGPNGKPDSLDNGEPSNYLDSEAPDLMLHLIDGCKIECSEVKGAVNGFENNRRTLDAVSVEEIVVDSPKIEKVNQLVVANDATSEIQKMEHPLQAENNPDNKKSEFVEEAKRPSLGPKMTHSTSPSKILGRRDRQCSVHSNSFSHDAIDDKTVSVTRSSSSLTDGPGSVARASPPNSSFCDVRVPDNTNNTHENNSSCSPDVHLHLEKAKLAVKSSNKWESLSSFEAIIKTLTRTKESIGRATRIAINCAKFGLATKVVELLVHSLERESSLHKKVDLFFLVDSITQCSKGMKGDAGVYPSAIQALLPRLLLAAAPSGSSSYQNHRQCLKVLRVWQERKILPEPIIRHHIQQLDALCGSYPSVSSRRPLRNERAFDDPIREMEGMLVDEYGSNSSIQLSGLGLPPMLGGDNGGSDSDGESFEAVTPEHNNENSNGETPLVQAVQKRSHILEDVDGELEMEDAAPSCEVGGSDTHGEEQHMKTPHNQFSNHYGVPFSTQPPKDVSMTVAPLSGPLPPPPPPPPPPQAPHPPSVLPPTVLNSVSNGHESRPYSSSQNFNGSLQESLVSQPVHPTVNVPPVDIGNRQGHGNNFEPQMPRQIMDSNNVSSCSDRPNAVLSGQASNGMQPPDAFSKGFHLRPPLPAPSNQFSYVQEPRIQTWGDIPPPPPPPPPPPHPNRFLPCNAENGNFYRDHDRNNFNPHDNVGDCWRPPYPGGSGPGSCYPDGPRMVHPPMYNGPPRDPSVPGMRWNYPPPPMNQGHFNHYGPPADGSIPVANRGPSYWRPPR